MTMIGPVLLTRPEIGLRCPSRAVGQFTQNSLKSPKVAEFRRVRSLAPQHIVGLRHEAAEIIGRSASDVRGVNELPRREFVGIQILLCEANALAPREMAD